MKDKDEFFENFDDEENGLYLFGNDFDLDFEELTDDDEEEITAYPTATIEPRRRLIEGLTMEYAEFVGRTFSGFQLAHFSLYGVTFRNCTFDNIDCQAGRIIACKFEDCNIISFSGEGYSFRECEFTRCKWSGNQYVDDVFFYSNCKYTDCTEEYDG